MGDQRGHDAAAGRRRSAPSSTRRVDAAFADPAALTAAFLVVHKGRIVAERYAPGITKDTQLESWSMGKSLAATLFALLVKDGTYTLEQPAPVPLWQAPGDPRGAIRNIDLLRMSAGLKFLGNQEPGSNARRYPDHYYIYTGRHRRVRLLDHAAAAVSAEHRRPLSQLRSADDRLPDQAGGHEARRELPHLAAARAVRPHRHPAAGARDRSVRQLPDHRLRLRHGAQLGAPRAALPAGRHVAGPAHPARRLGEVRQHAGAGVEAAGVRRVLLAEPRSTRWNLPPETYFAAGAGGQNTWIVPSHDLVIVRMGHMRGQGPARRATNTALGLVMEAVGWKGTGSAAGR